MKANAWNIFKNICIIIALTLCMLGFVWICYGQVTKFFQELTIVNTEYNLDTNPFPNVVFCSREGFKQNFKSVNTDRNTYDNYAIPVNVLLKALWTNDTGPAVSVNSTVSDLYTKYNGKCRVFKILQKIKSSDMLQFKLSKSEENFVAIIPGGEELFLIAQLWLNGNPTFIEISSDMKIYIEWYINTKIEFLKIVK